MSIDLLEIPRGQGAIGQWLSKLSELQLQLQNETKEFTISLQSGDDGLYDYYPFLTNIYVDGELAAICEFSTDWETISIRLRVPSNEKSIKIRFVSELGAVPAERGLGADRRELAVFALSIEEHTDTIIPTKCSAPNFAHGDHPSPVKTGVQKPVFIIGTYRSGTSISTWAVGQHPNHQIPHGSR